MKSFHVLMVLVFTVVLAACDAGGDATCGVCGHSFTPAECMSIAASHGCTSGETQPDTLCSPSVTGCSFHGCPAGGIMCTTGGDGGP